MQTREYHGNETRRILIGMVTDRIVLARITARWTDDGFFESSWENLIAGWCVQYYQKHGDAPGRQIESMFESYAARSQNEDTVQSIEKFLARLSEEYESEEIPTASDYIIDLAGKHFNKVTMRKALRDAEEELDRNQPDAAATILANVRRIQLGMGSFIEPNADVDIWQRAFDPERQRPLVAYPGDLGRMVNSSMLRNSLIAWMAPDKIGKTTWLIDFAYRALRQRCRVAYFDAGDMTDEDVIRRLGIRIMRRPQWNETLDIPTGFNDDGVPTFKREKYKALTDIAAYRGFQKLTRNSERFRLTCEGNDTLSVDEILDRTHEWAEDGWVPDVIIIDYADILAAPNGVKDPLEQIDTTWKRLRRLSQEMHCLVMTATQSNASAYKDGEKKGVLTRKNFSGRKTKLAHVNGMLALNVTPEEKGKGISRVNWVVRRNDAFNDRAWVTCVGNIGIGQPVMVSRR